jgi:hypothetical protein
MAFESVGQVTARLLAGMVRDRETRQAANDNKPLRKRERPQSLVDNAGRPSAGSNFTPELDGKPANDDNEVMRIAPPALRGRE